MEKSTVEILDPDGDFEIIGLPGDEPELNEIADKLILPEVDEAVLTLSFQSDETALAGLRRVKLPQNFYNS